MDGLLKGEGVLHYSYEKGVYRLVVDIDKAITLFYRSLVPKTVRLNPQKFAPHITVVRETSLPEPSTRWGAYEGEPLVFDYSPAIRVGEVYYWLEVFSTFLGNVRVELGLPILSPNTRPPDGADCFHTTLGNLKAV